MTITAERKNKKTGLNLQASTLLLLLHPFNGLFSRKTCVSRYQKGKTSVQEMMAFGGTVASTGPYANNLQLAPDR